MPPCCELGWARGWLWGKGGGGGACYRTSWLGAACGWALGVVGALLHTALLGLPGVGRGGTVPLFRFLFWLGVVGVCGQLGGVGEHANHRTLRLVQT